MQTYPSTMSSPYLIGTLVEEVEMFSCSGENMGTVCLCVCLSMCASEDPGSSAMTTTLSHGQSQLRLGFITSCFFLISAAWILYREKGRKTLGQLNIKVNAKVIFWSCITKLKTRMAFEEHRSSTTIDNATLISKPATATTFHAMHQRQMLYLTKLVKLKLNLCDLDLLRKRRTWWH